LAIDPTLVPWYEDAAMINQTTQFFAVLLCALVLQSQQGMERPFARFEHAVKEESGGWAGNKERLSTVFDAERKRLGNRFEDELLKWLGNDPEKHYWISLFLESESYLHGSKRLPQLSLLVKQQGLALVQGKDDEESRGYVVRLGMTAAILSEELGFRALASSYKSEAEGMLLRNPNLSVYVPAVTEAERQRYDKIKSVVSNNVPTITSDSNPPPKARVSGGIVNGRAINFVKPAYPKAARQAGASGKVEVRIVFDEKGDVIWARAMSGHPELRQAAEDAAWKTKFSPTVLSGETVKTTGILLYNFIP
jgi:TonB family protein